MIYLDNAATTPIDSEVYDEYVSAMQNSFANPGSLHVLGAEAAILTEEARENITSVLNVGKDEIIYTSGGSEGNSLCILGSYFEFKKRNPFLNGHAVTFTDEHKSVLKAYEFLSDTFNVEVTYLKKDKEGNFDFNELEACIRPDSFLVSLMAANNETGVVYNVKEVSSFLKDKGIRVHSDAVSAFPYIENIVESTGADLISVSGHKFNAPKGSGFIYKRKGVNLEPIIFGGGQEFMLRGGTENASLVHALSVAVKKNADLKKKKAGYIDELRSIFVNSLKNSVRDVYVNFDGTNRLPGIVSLKVLGINNLTLISRLSARGVYISGGSACEGANLSHVLKSFNFTSDEIRQTVRISISYENTKEEMIKAASLFKEEIEFLRGL